MEDIVPLPPPGSEAASTEVVIAGAGPVGLFLGCILRQNGVDVVILDPHIAPSRYSPASVTMPRTLEVLNLVNVGAWIASMGRAVDLARIGLGGRKWHGVVQHLGTSAHRHSRHRATCISQGKIEAVLAQRYKELGGRLFRAARLTGSAEGKDSVEVTVQRYAQPRPGDEAPELPAHLTQVNETVLSASYVVGCDGEKSQVRTNMEVSYVGHEYNQAFLVVDAEISREEEQAVGWDRYQVQLMADWRHSSFVFTSHLEANTWRIYVSATKGLDESKATEAFVRHKLERLLPSDSVPRHATFGKVGFFKVGCKLAETYRKGRHLLAGDAAHRLSPAGSQGMNTGLQEAANLGWKITAVLKGQADEALLDSYEQERRNVAKGILVQSDLTYKYLTGDASTCTSLIRLLTLRTAFCCCPNEELPPESLKDNVFGLSHTYANLGTSWNHGDFAPHTALAAGDRLPDLPCSRLDGHEQYLLEVLKDPPCNAYHVIFVAASGTGGPGASQPAPIPDVCKEIAEGLEPLVTALGARFPLATCVYIEDLATGTGEASPVKVLAPSKVAPNPTLVTLMMLPAASKAILLVRPDGYIAVCHRGDWNTEAWARAVIKIVHPAQPAPQ
mmetsp:Transcript_34300/g.80197  ORF Transcript_34300/g.80197 Transcript_34300/m.80197 type:complete len:616 (-) Transcript_34300:41-1888(-)